MEKKKLELSLEKETKNTFRYEEETEGEPPVIKNLYIQKWFAGKKPPEKIKVVITEGK